MRAARRRLLVGSLLIAASLGVGTVWAGRNLGHMPTYADSGAYFRLAGKETVDQYRGVLYPRLLAQMDRLVPGPSILRRHARGLVWVQALQMLVSLAALVFFVVTLRPLDAWTPDSGDRRRLLAPALVVALLWLDPLVSHFNLSIMTDSLALSASLVFCAAFGAALTRAAPPRALAAAMFAAHLVLGAIRPEKNLVVLGTALATIGGLLAWRRFRGAPSEPPPLRLLALGTVVVLGFVATAAVQRATSEPSRRMSTSDWILHHRIIYPHLTSVYPELPDDLKRRIPPRLARRYDANPLGPRKVIPRIAKGPEARSRVTRRLAAIVIRERWGRIAVDVLTDTAENLFASLSFYGRLGLLAVVDEATAKRLEHSAGTGYTYGKLSQATPDLSRAHTAISALLLISGCVALVTAARSRRAAGSAMVSMPAPSTPAWMRWAPAAGFCLMNALAFSLTADLVHVRYTLFAHAVFVAFAYGALVAWTLASPAGTARLTGPTVPVGGADLVEDD